MTTTLLRSVMLMMVISRLSGSLIVSKVLRRLMTVSPSTSSIVPLPVIRMTTTPLRSVVLMTGISRLSVSLLVPMVRRIEKDDKKAL